MPNRHIPKASRYGTKQEKSVDNYNLEEDISEAIPSTHS